MAGGGPLHGWNRDRRYGLAVARPGLQLDAGWLFLAAGLAICSAGVLVPAYADREAVRREADLLAGRVAWAEARLQARRLFLRRIDEKDPSVLRRLAAAQLDLVPSGESPVLEAAGRSATISRWIDESVAAPATDLAPSAAGVSILERLATGPKRLLLVAAGILAVFAGLVMGGTERPARCRISLEPEERTCVVRGPPRRRLVLRRRRPELATRLPD